VTNSQGDAWLKISGVIGILTPIVAFTCVFLAIAYSSHFSWTDNALSDLGVQEGITSVLFNYGLVLSGGLALIFASGLFVFLSDRISGRIGSFLFILDALALTAIGVFPENFRPMHGYASVAFFVLLPLSMLVLDATFLLMGKMKMGLFTLLVAIIAVAPWIGYFAMHFVEGVAIPETIFALSASAWVIVLGFKMLKEASHSSK